MARIAVVGSGAWGTALACHLARLEHAVTMWAYEPEVAEEIATRHTNSPYLPDVSLPETIRASVDARKVQDLVHSVALRTYTSADPVGVQVGGAVKNVMAVATGACDGLRFGLNARAALITRGLAEMTRLGVVLGADPLTFLGLAGVGDLVLTCTGDLSRNRTLGMRVAEGADPAAYLAGQRSVAEGFSTAAAAYELGRKVGVEMPVTEQVYHVLHRGRPLLEAVRQLLERRYKEELQGIRGS